MFHSSMSISMFAYSIISFVHMYIIPAYLLNFESTLYANFPSYVMQFGVCIFYIIMVCNGCVKFYCIVGCLSSSVS